MKTQQEVKRMLEVQTHRHEVLQQIIKLLEDLAEEEGDNEGQEWVLDQLAE